METKKSYIVWQILGMILLFATVHSCIDQIDLNTVEVGEVLVIEGAVYSGGELPEVNIRRSGSFSAGPDGVQQKVTGAMVKIIEIGGTSVDLSEIEPGRYVAQQHIGTIGKEYRLEVQVEEESYVSLTELMPDRIPISALNWDVKDLAIENEAGNVETAKNVVIMSDANLPNIGEGTFLRYRVSSVYEFRERAAGNNPTASFCYVDDAVDLNNLAVIDGREVNGGNLIDQTILQKRLDKKFAWNVCFTVVQQSISKNSYNYWNSIQNEFERTGDIFEAPPAKIKGNVFNTIATKNDVIGVFSAISPDTAKILVSGLNIDENICQCQCWPPPRAGDVCYDCLRLENSSLNKPECL